MDNLKLFIPTWFSWMTSVTFSRMTWHKLLNYEVQGLFEYAEWRFHRQINCFVDNVIDSHNRLEHILCFWVFIVLVDQYIGLFLYWGGIQYKKRPIYWSIILVAHNLNEFLESTGVWMKWPTLYLIVTYSNRKDVWSIKNPLPSILFVRVVSTIQLLLDFGSKI